MKSIPIGVRAYIEDAQNNCKKLNMYNFAMLPCSRIMARPVACRCAGGIFLLHGVGRMPANIELLKERCQTERIA